MKYNIIIEKPALKFIDKQSANDKKRILKAIYQLPQTGDIKPLKGYKNYYRLRVGDYRIIYTIENSILTVVVTHAGNRGEVYKCI